MTGDPATGGRFETPRAPRIAIAALCLYLILKLCSSVAAVLAERARGLPFFGLVVLAVIGLLIVAGVGLVTLLATQGRPSSRFVILPFILFELIIVSSLGGDQDAITLLGFAAVLVAAVCLWLPSTRAAFRARSQNRKLLRARGPKSPDEPPALT